MVAVTPDKDAFLDCTGFQLDADQFGAFMTQLDAPPAPNERLRELLATPAPWDERRPVSYPRRNPPSG